MRRSFLFSSAFLSAAISPLALTVMACSNNNPNILTTASKIKVAQFNASLAVDNDPEESLERWVKFFSYTREQQEQEIEKWRATQGEVVAGKLTQAEKDLAERLIQIRNIAAIIQKNRPDVLLINEFNSDGMGGNQTMELFQKNYLAHPQSLNGPDGGDMQEPIIYPEIQAYATNTGLDTDMDLDNDGTPNNSPNDKYGFGFYHGHYAFGLMSKFKIDRQNTRTFQKFLWKDARDGNGKLAEIPKVIKNGKPGQMPNGMQIGSDWFTAEEWNKLRLSSKNHVDVPIIVNGESIHLLLSHPTPPAFDTVTETNMIRNGLEVAFWKHYIENQSWIYDDNGKPGGLDGANQKFIIMGDLNADNIDSKNNAKSREGITALASSPLVNSEFATGAKIPTSNGGRNEENKNQHQKPEARTSTFGLRVDWTLPSKNLEIENSGVYWQAEGEPGRKLFNDKRIGQGWSKWISSDHRMVWVDLNLEKK